MTLNRNKIHLLFILLLPLSLWGCPKSTTFSIYNNSDSDFVVHYTNGESVWKRGTLLFLAGGDLDRIVWAKRSDGMMLPMLDVSTGSQNLRYQLIGAKPLPPDYWANRSSQEDYYFQIEPDGLLYAVKPADRFPLVVPVPQPDGYPIRPASHR